MDKILVLDTFKDIWGPIVHYGHNNWFGHIIAQNLKLRSKRNAQTFLKADRYKTLSLSTIVIHHKKWYSWGMGPQVTFLFSREKKMDLYSKCICDKTSLFLYLPHLFIIDFPI